MAIFKLENRIELFYKRPYEQHWGVNNTYLAFDLDDNLPTKLQNVGINTQSINKIDFSGKNSNNDSELLKQLETILLLFPAITSLSADNLKFIGVDDWKTFFQMLPRNLKSLSLSIDDLGAFFIDESHMEGIEFPEKFLERYSQENFKRIFQHLPPLLETFDIYDSVVGRLEELPKIFSCLPKQLKAINFNIPTVTFSTFNKTAFFRCLDALPSAEIKVTAQQSVGTSSASRGKYRLLAGNYDEIATDWIEYKSNQLITQVFEHINSNEKKPLALVGFSPKLSSIELLCSKTNPLYMLTLGMLTHGYIRRELGDDDIEDIQGIEGKEYIIIPTEETINKSVALYSKAIETAQNVKNSLIQEQNGLLAKLEKLKKDGALNAELIESGLVNAIGFADAKSALAHSYSEMKNLILSGVKGALDECQAVEDFSNFLLWEIKAVATYPQISAKMELLQIGNPAAIISAQTSHSFFSKAKNNVAELQTKDDNVVSKRVTRTHSF